MTGVERATRWSAVERSGAAVAALLAAGAYAASVTYGFVYDDVYVVQRNDVVHSLANWWQILTSPYWGPALYRPVTSLSFALDWVLGGGHATLFHAGNVLLHVAVTVGVFALARRYLRPLAATSVAILFAVHPVHTEAVAGVVGRSEMLATLFAVLAALAYGADGRLAAQGQQRGRRWFTSVGSLVLLVLALGAKESAFAVPALFLLVDWLDARTAGEPALGRFARHRWLWFASVVLTAEFLLIRASVVGSLAGVDAAPGLEGLGIGGRLAAMLPVVLQYARLLVVPVHLSADYSPDFLRVVPQFGWAAAAGAGVVIAAAVVALWAARRGAPVVTFGLAWCAAALVVVSNVLVPSGVVLAERSLYLPSVGAVFVAGWVIEWAAARRPAVTTVAVAAVAGLGLLRTVTRIPVWRDASAFFPALVRDAPGSYRAFWIASAAAFGSGDRERGEALLARALEINPLYPNLWEFAAERHAEAREWRRAADERRAAFLLDTARTTTAARGVLDYLRAGETDSAMTLGMRALRADGDDPNVPLALGEVARARGRPLAEMTYRRMAAWQRPTVARYWLLDLEAALDAGYCPEARRAASRLRAGWAEAPYTEEAVRRVAAAGCGTVP